MAGLDAAADAIALLPAPEHLSLQPRQRDGVPITFVSIYTSIYPSFCMSTSLWFICISIYPSIYLPIYIHQPQTVNSQPQNIDVLTEIRYDCTVIQLRAPLNPKPWTLNPKACQFLCWRNLVCPLFELFTNCWVVLMWWEAAVRNPSPFTRTSELETQIPNPKPYLTESLYMVALQKSNPPQICQLSLWCC